MPAETLEALRLVTNLETEKMKLLQVVLFGQPELDVILALPALRQLLQRVTFSYALQPLDIATTKEYIEHRLSCAGYSGEFPLEPAALKYLYRASGGIPRIINVLIHKALMCAYGKQTQKISKHFIKAAVDDTEGVCRPKVLSMMLMRRAAAITVLALPAVELASHFSVGVLA